MSKEPKEAKGVRGFLLYSPFSKTHFFRVYSEDKSNFKDYKICAEDIEIEILDQFIVLNEGTEIGTMDYSDSVLGKERK